MKNINNFISERFQSNGTNKDAMFLHKDGLRASEDFKFTPGEKALLMGYDTDGYRIQNRGIVEIAKVLKNSVKIKGEDESETEFYNGLKFDKTGIAIVKTNSKYRGKSTKYYVLYNKELIDDKDGKDLQEIIDKGTCTWGFKLSGDDERKKEAIKNLKKYLKELK